MEWEYLKRLQWNKADRLLLEQHLNRMQGSADFLKLGSCAERGLTKKNRRISEYTGNVGEDAWST